MDYVFTKINNNEKNIRLLFNTQVIIEEEFH